MEEIIQRYKVNISWEAIALNGGYYWFASDYYNALFRFPEDKILDKEDTVIEAEFYGIFPNERRTSRLWSSIEVYDKELIFIPWSADNICIYNIEEETFRVIQIKVPAQLNYRTVLYSDVSKFSFCVREGNCIILFPYSYPALVVLDMDAYEVKYISSPIKQISNMINNNGGYFGKCKFKRLKNEKIVVWSRVIMSLIAIDLYDYHIEIIRQINLQKPYYDAVCDEDSWWLIPHMKNSSVVYFNEKGDSFQEIQLPIGIQTGDNIFADSQIIGDKIIVFPKVCDEGIIVDMKTNNIEFIDELEYMAKNCFDGEKWNFRSTNRIDNLILAYSSGLEEMFIMDFEKNELYSKKIVVSGYGDSCISDFRKFIIQMEQNWNTGIYPESSVIKISDFLRII